MKRKCENGRDGGRVKMGGMGEQEKRLNVERVEMGETGGGGRNKRDGQNDGQ